jgi:mannose-6-phosphate isomerase-like protein (cupin superfamily)
MVADYTRRAFQNPHVRQGNKWHLYDARIDRGPPKRCANAHQNEDEHFIILEGMLHVANGNQRFDAPAGTTVTVNKGVAHAWCNLQDTPLRMLVVFSPGDIEGLFKATAARETDDIAALAARYGTLLVGPALLEEIHTITSPRT